MSTNSRLSRENCEKAFTAFIDASRAIPGAPASVLELPILARKGKLDQDGKFQLPGITDSDDPNHDDAINDLPIPCICIAAPRAVPHAAGYDVVELHLLGLNSVDEPECGARSAERFGWLAGLFTDEVNAAVIEALNKPASGPDTRVARDFMVFGFYLTEDQGQETDRHWIDHLLFEVHCQSTDDTSLTSQ